jgi:hypothetical protein
MMTAQSVNSVIIFNQRFLQRTAHSGTEIVNSHRAEEEEEEEERFSNTSSSKKGIYSFVIVC